MILLRGRTLLPHLCRKKMEVYLHFTGIPQIDFFSSISTLLAGEVFFFKHLLKELNKCVCNVSFNFIIEWYREWTDLSVSRCSLSVTPNSQKKKLLKNE